jgi:phosphohistidine phosphatase SixA
MKQSNIFIATHGLRLKCFIHKYFPTSNNKKSYKNCAILRLMNNNKNQLILDLVYEGHGTSTHNHSINDYQTLVSPENINLNNKIIYLIRHAEGHHNTYSKLQKFTTELFSRDPHLTQIGMNQAFETGLFIKENIIKKNDTNKFYSSYMMRAICTIGQVMYACNISRHHKINILPCTHEVPYRPKLLNLKFSCDATALITYAENASKCRKKDYRDKHTNCVLFINYEINWNIYDEFVKNKMRCRDTSFIYNIID